MTSRLFVRCTEGHPYDRNLNEACPVCGAAPAGPGGGPSPSPTPVPKRAHLLAAAVAIALAAGGLGFFLRSPASETPSPPPSTATTNRPETRQAEQQPGPSSGNASPGAKPETPPAQTPAPQPASPSPAATDRTGAPVQDTKTPPESDAEAAERLARYMTVDPAILEPLKRALAPIDPKDVDPLLASLSPAGAEQLRLSVLLREQLVNEAANVAYRAHDLDKVRICLSALVSQPPLAPGIITFAAHKNLAFVLAGAGASEGDMAVAGQLATTAAKQGFAPAVGLLVNRPDVLKAARIDAATLQTGLRLAALQDQQLATAATEHGVDVGALNAIQAAFNAALSRRDWPAAVRAYQSAGATQIPKMDAVFARKLLFDKDDARFLDRALVSAVAGTLALFFDASDTLSYFPEYGLDGVVKDAPNAAGWMMLALKGAPPDDPFWNTTRKRYQKLKSAMSPDQRQALAQIAQQLGAP